MNSLKRQTINGVAWSAVERFSVQGTQFVLSIILARLVAPAEYGLIAMLAIFIAIAQCFVDSGFSNALIQKKDRNNVDISTIFYFNIVVSLGIYGILFLLAPYIADFYRVPVLVVICRILGLDVILNSFALAQRTILQINVDFKRLTGISFISVIVSGLLGVFFAWKGMGVWALLIQRVVNTFLQTLLLWITSSWRPLCVFSKESFKGLFSFGSKLLLGGLLHNIFMNLYPLIIGRYFTPINVGFFNRAQQFAAFPSNTIVGIVTRVSYPLLCKMQDDITHMEDAQLRMIRSIALVVFPLMTGFAILAEPIIRVLLTDEWLPAAPMLSILCLSYMWYPVMQQNWQLLNVRGRSDLALKAEFIKKIVALILLFGSIPFGIKAVCISLVIYSFCDMFIILMFVRKITSIGFRAEGKALLPICTITAIMGGCVWGIKACIHIPMFTLLVGILVGAFVYLFLIYIICLPERKMLVKLIRKGNYE